MKKLLLILVLISNFTISKTTVVEHNKEIISISISIEKCQAQFVENADNNYVLVLPGQSNTAGFPPLDSCFAPYRKNGNLMIYNGSSFAVMDAAINNNQYPSASGLFAYEMSLGYSLQNYTKGNVYIIKYAIGGTAMEDFWKVSLGTGYTNLKNTITNALATLTVPYEVVGVYWYQGESDCTASYAPLYSASLNTFLAQLRIDLSMPDLFYYIIRIHKDSPYNNTYEAQIRAADSLFVDGDGGNSTWVSVDDLARYTGSAHISALSQITLGNRLVDSTIVNYNIRIRKYHP